MKALGFGERWIRLVSSCISSVSCFLLINGQPGKIFVPSSELRQGDPLSLCLFLMCAKSFSSFIFSAKKRGEVQGMAMVKRSTSINHLLFAYDNILFCRASNKEWCRIQNILDIYEKASGQTINKQNSSLFFSSNTPFSTKQGILHEVRGSIYKNYDNYLGLPALIGKYKYNTF